MGLAPELILAMLKYPKMFKTDYNKINRFLSDKEAHEKREVAANGPELDKSVVNEATRCVRKSDGKLIPRRPHSEEEEASDQPAYLPCDVPVCSFCLMKYLEGKTSWTETLSKVLGTDECPNEKCDERLNGHGLTDPMPTLV